jgi:hypothetical protein
MRGTLAIAVSALLGLGLAAPCRSAEIVRSGPVRLNIGGEASASLAEEDHGYFNNQEYDQNVLRLVRLRLTTEMRFGNHVAVLGEARHTNLDHPRLYALYVRVRPWLRLPLDLQAGQVPPVFGAYPRRSYAADNPLIGEPLGYQYLTSLRPDAAPATVSDLLAMRGRGWRVHYPLGDTVEAPGLVPISTLRWDTGIQAHLESDVFEAAVAVTQGSPSHPVVRDDNNGKGLSARLAWRSGTGFTAGVSASRARYLEGDLERQVGRGARVQQALGADVEYTRGRWRLRAEGFAAGWDLPLHDPTVADCTLSAWTAMAEIRVKLRPGWSAAARADHLDFGAIDTGSQLTPWDHAVTRYEAGISFTPHRNAILKLAVQRDLRDGGFVHHHSFIAGQVLLWF